MIDFNIQEILSQNYSEITKNSVFEILSGGSENYNYRVDNKYVCTILGRRSSIKNLEFVTEYTNFLARHKMLSLHILPNIHGKFYIEIENDIVILQPFLSGKVLENSEITVKHSYNLGLALGQCHKIVHFKNFTPHRQTVTNLQHLTNYLQNIETDNLLTKLSIYLETEYSKNFHEDYIPIHGDLFEDNVLFDIDGNLVAIIDFHFAENFSRYFDLGTVLCNWVKIEEYTSWNKILQNDIWQEFERGYIQSNLAIDKNILLYWAIYSAVRFFVTRHQDYGSNNPTRLNPNVMLNKCKIFEKII